MIHRAQSWIPHTLRFNRSLREKFMESSSQSGKRSLLFMSQVLKPICLANSSSSATGSLVESVPLPNICWLVLAGCLFSSQGLVDRNLELLSSWSTYAEEGGTAKRFGNSWEWEHITFHSLLALYVQEIPRVDGELSRSCFLSQHLKQCRYSVHGL